MQGTANLKYAIKSDATFIIRYFEDFYGEVLRQKVLVTGRSAFAHSEEIGVEEINLYEPDLTPDVKAGPIENSTDEDKNAPASHRKAALPEEIINRLLTLLNSQSIDAIRYGGEFAGKYYKEAEFIMAALADEIFLHLDWSGKEYWEKNLLESRLYGTHSAGETFFERLDLFLQNRDPSRADLAMLYLLALGLGFKGKYRNHQDPKKLNQYRRELFIFINHRDPTLYELGTRIFPDAYAHTIDTGKVRKLDDINQWLRIYAGIGLGMLLASYVVWSAATSSTYRLSNNIMEIAEEL